MYDYFELVKMYEKNKKEINNLKCKNYDLKERIDKAIDYLYKHSQYNDADGIHYINDDEYCVDYLLDILKGDSNE